jgi:apolipoprotein N-acyltransferase
MPHNSNTIEFWNPKITGWSIAILSVGMFLCVAFLGFDWRLLCILIFLGIIPHTMNWKTLWQQSEDEKTALKTRMIISGVSFLISLFLLLGTDVTNMMNSLGGILRPILGVILCVVPIPVQTIYIIKKYGNETQKKSLKIKENSLKIKFTINPITIGE